MKNVKVILLIIALFALNAYAGTNDNFNAKPIFDKIDSALNDTYVAAILTVGLIWRGFSIWKETGDTNKAAPFAIGGAALGSLATIAKSISGAII